MKINFKKKCGVCGVWTYGTLTDNKCNICYFEHKEKKKGHH